MVDGPAWSEARLLRLIVERTRESATLEFKGAEALSRQDRAKIQISKDVAAFANAGGGTIIYGIAEGDGSEAERLDPIDPTKASKEWLDDIISSGIQRRIDGLRIHVVDLTQSRVGRVAYVVEIPQSTRAPHMAADHRYYKRHNFKIEPMEEYEVRDVALRSHAPDLFLQFYGSLGPSSPMTDRNIQLDMVLINDSPEPANTAQVTLSVDARLLVDGGTRHGDVWSTSGEEPRMLPTIEFTFLWGGPAQFPAFSGVMAKVTAVRFEALDRSNRGPYVVWWKIASPRSPERQGALVIHWESDSRLSYNSMSLDDLAAYERVSWCTSQEEAGTHFAALHDAHDKRRTARDPNAGG
jgi:hypothetical protein